jgi:hypothetical protein
MNYLIDIINTIINDKALRHILLSTIIQENGNDKVTYIGLLKRVSEMN